MDGRSSTRPASSLMPKPAKAYVEDLDGEQQSGSGEGGATTAIPRRAKWSAHFRRFLIPYLGGVVLLLLSIILFIFVIFPAIVQALVKRAPLSVQSVSMLAPTPNTVDLSMVASLAVPKPFTVDLKPFNLSLFRRDIKPVSPYAQLALSESRLQGNSTIRVDQQTAKILNATELVGFLSDALNGETFKLSVLGTTDLFIGKLKARVTLDKDIELKGLNKFKGFNISSAQALLPPQNGNNLGGNVTLPNPMIVTLELGNVTFNLGIENLNVGQITIQNLILTPGDNPNPFAGTIDIGAILRNARQITATESQSLQDGNLVVTTTGNATVRDGQHLPFFEDVLSELSLQSQLSIGQFVRGTLGSALQNAGLTPLGPGLTALGPGL